MAKFFVKNMNKKQEKEKEKEVYFSLEEICGHIRFIAHDGEYDWNIATINKDGIMELHDHLDDTIGLQLDEESRIKIKRRIKKWLNLR